MRKTITNMVYRRVYKAFYDFVVASENPCKVLNDEINGNPYIPVGKPAHLLPMGRIETLWNSKSPRVKLYRANLVKLAVKKHYYGYIYRSKINAYNIDSFVIEKILKEIKDDYKEAKEFGPSFSSTKNIYPISLSGMA